MKRSSDRNDIGSAWSRRSFLQATAAGGTLMAAGCATPSKDAPPPTGADVIYFGGPIRTMVKEGEHVGALAIKDGKILRLGTWAEIIALRGPQTKVIDLEGRCLMPGFIDAHSHLSLFSAKLAAVALDPKPMGDIGSIEDIQRKLRRHVSEQRPAKDAWIVGWGYDNTALAQRRHPLREDLDAIATEYPIVLLHASGHAMAGNSRLFEVIGVSAATPDPVGGSFQRRTGSRELNGVIEGRALQAVLAQIPTPSAEQATAMLERGLAQYAAAGITTAQDGALGAGAASLLAAMANTGKLPIDVVGYARHASADEKLLAAIARDGKAPGRFRLAGVEISIDGSLAGNSAYLTRPYTTPPKAQDVLGDLCDDADLEHGFVSRLTPLSRAVVPPASGSGVADMTQDEVTSWVRRCDAQGVQLAVHANGDAALDRLQEAIKAVRGDQSRPALRTVVKNEIMREDQVDFAARHALLPTFAPMSLLYRGERQRGDAIGPERAERVAAAGDCLRRDIKFTLHHDAPLAGANMLPLVAVAVNRFSASGKSLSPRQRVTSYAAFRAITIDAAWQCFEEQRKGTLEVGKLADLVILSNDPFSMPQDRIGLTRVMETIKEGKVVFRRT